MGKGKVKLVGERAIDQRHLDAARELELAAKHSAARARDYAFERRRHAQGSELERYYAGAKVAHETTASRLRRRARVIRAAARARSKGAK